MLCISKVKNRKVFYMRRMHEQVKQQEIPKACLEEKKSVGFKESRTIRVGRNNNRTGIPKRESIQFSK